MCMHVCARACVCVCSVLMGRNMVRTLLQHDDYIGALEVIRSTQQVYERECFSMASMVNIGKVRFIYLPFAHMHTYFYSSILI
jgi:hypothetical protein